MPAYAPISAAVIGANAVLPAIPGYRYFVHNYTAVGSNAVNMTWKSGTTPLTGLIAIGAAGGGVSPHGGGSSFDPLFLFATNLGDALNLVLDGAVNVGGHITYTIGTV